MSTQLRKASHSVFSIHLHVIFVTKYRRKVLTKAMIEDAKRVFERILESNQSILSNCQGESDHLHLLIDLHPNNNISNLVSSLKSASSRIIRKKYPQEIAKFYWGKKRALWHDSKCIISCGGAPLEVIKEYIENQSGGRE
ncbi:MAG: IS200/IS605 family transposase [Xenococcaceae cyanobacterium MO_207.B15]|nr:IS200/IS605 family transposase [Xenococcaceae cyanobacterium MO_207.B15]